MSNKPSHFTDVIYNIIKACIIVGILATVTGYFIDASQRDTIIIQGLPERTSASETAAATAVTVRSAQPVEEARTATEQIETTSESTAAPQTPIKINITELKNSISEPEPETDSKPEPDSDSVPEQAAETALININTASAAALTQLNGIGEAKADAIVKYREEHGGFKSIDELVNVSGIGEKTLEKNRDKITV